MSHAYTSSAIHPSACPVRADDLPVICGPLHVMQGLLAASVKRWRSAGERTAVAEPDAAPSPAGGELGAPFVPAESDEHAR